MTRKEKGDTVRVSCVPVVAFRGATGHRPLHHRVGGGGGRQLNGISPANHNLCKVNILKGTLALPAEQLTIDTVLRLFTTEN